MLSFLAFGPLFWSAEVDARLKINSVRKPITQWGGHEQRRSDEWCYVGRMVNIRKKIIY